MSATRSIVFAGLCVALGPPFGAALALGIVALQAILAGDGPTLSEFFGVVFQVMLWSYALVWLTAAATALIGGIVLLLVRPFVLRLAIVPLIGTLATAFGVPLTGDFLMRPELAPVMLLTGALVSLSFLLLAERVLGRAGQG